MKVALIGACDRNNYGDLLMPIIIEKQFVKKYPLLSENIYFETYGMKKSNMEYLKSNNTKPLYKCYGDCDIAIVVGGEVLKSDYKLMYLNLQKSKTRILFLRIFNKLFPNIVECYSKSRLNGYENAPWVLDKKKINCKKIIYNTVGGKLINEKNNASLINKLDYISIRNKNDYEEIKTINKKAKLFPDSIITISNYFTENDFQANVSKEVRNIIKEDYFILQINNRDSKGEIKEISKQINMICNKYNINCVLLPIGYAQGHEDQKPLKKIANLCNNKRVKYIDNTNIYETTYIIKKSKLFIGTSLHGIVVSSSYDIPHMILTNKIKKMIDYIKTWNSSSIIYSDSNSIYDNFVKIYGNYNKEKKNLDVCRKNMIAAAEENFNNINNIIIGEYNNGKEV